MSWSGYDPYGRTRQAAPEGYDVMQVCLNGHTITDTAATQPEFAKPFCSNCGERTITTCPECRAPIQGTYHVPGVAVLAFAIPKAPNNCHACGTAYPWRQAAIANAIEVLQLDLEGQDAADVAELVRAVSVETPRTEVAALKLKRLLPKLGKATYDVAIKVISDFASEAAKKTLGL